MRSDIDIYARCMKKVKQRIGIIRWLLRDDPLGKGKSMLSTELLFVQFRKALELIAFSSLTANKEEYARKFPDFRNDAKAKAMLKDIEAINPNFYPVPLTQITIEDEIGPLRGEDLRVSHPNRVRHLLRHRKRAPPHAKPDSEKDPLTRLPYSETAYADRIQALVELHYIQLVDDDTFWLVQVPGSGEVTVRASKRQPV